LGLTPLRLPRATRNQPESIRILHPKKKKKPVILQKNPGTEFFAKTPFFETHCFVPGCLDARFCLILHCLGVLCA